MAYRKARIDDFHGILGCSVRHLAICGKLAACGAKHISDDEPLVVAIWCNHYFDIIWDRLFIKICRDTATAFLVGYIQAIESEILEPVLVCSVLALACWHRHSIRFSLRTLLIATTLVAAVLGAVVWTSR